MSYEGARAERHHHHSSPRSRWWWIAPLAVVVVGIGAVLGLLWADRDGDQAEADARVAFVDWVDPGAVDATRDAIVTDAGGVEGIVAGHRGVEEVELVMPAGRTFIDVVVVASSESAAVAAASEGADVLVATEERTAGEAIDAEIEALEASIGEIADEVARHETDMEELLAVEAAAEASRATGQDAATIEAAIVTARNASDEYWNVARRRNALLDQENEFERTIRRLRAERAEPGNLAVVSAAKVVDDGGIDPRVAGAVGGALVGLAVVLAAVWLLGREPE